uniref:Uncharacterized protein n=1 Tax=Oryza brachyantha TaxID=4533 RepID=J3MNY8_ORYBR
MAYRAGAPGGDAHLGEEPQEVSPPRRKKGGFGQWFGGAVGEMLTGGEMMSSDTAAYEAGVADGRIVKF